MKVKGRRVSVHHRKRLNWRLKNNIGFIAVVVAACLIVSLIFGYQAYNFSRIKSMEAVLGKTQYDVHRKTGLTDLDVSKLQKVYPEFNWEGTWDRKRWQGGQEWKKEQDRRERGSRQ